MDCAGPVVASPFSGDASRFLRDGCKLGSDVAPALPAGFPPSFNHPLAWTSTQFSDETEYVCRLDNTEVAELRSGVDAFRGTSHLYGRIRSEPGMTC